MGLVCKVCHNLEDYSYTSEHFRSTRRIFNLPMQMGNRLHHACVICFCGCGLWGVDTPKGYCFFLTNLPNSVSAWEASEIYRTRWEVETNFKLDKSEQGLDEAASPASVNPHAVRALMRASLISSTLTTLLVHKYNSSVKKNAAGERIEASLHPRRLAMQLVVSSSSIIAAMGLEGADAQKTWARGRDSDNLRS